MIWLFILLIISGGVSHHYQYSTVAQAAPGEASPYSVSSELYKHVLPGEHSAENIYADIVHVDILALGCIAVFVFYQKICILGQKVVLVKAF